MKKKKKSGGEDNRQAVCRSFAPVWPGIGDLKTSAVFSWYPVERFYIKRSAAITSFVKTGTVRADI
jgi:hypothetical protein